VGGRLQRGLADQLKQCWSVEVADLPAGDSGCAFVKLEPLFGRGPGGKFLVVDSDTVLAGPILQAWSGSLVQFVVDDENNKRPMLRQSTTTGKKYAGLARTPNHPGSYSRPGSGPGQGVHLPGMRQNAG
jgi:hypothetical protein